MIELTRIKSVLYSDLSKEKKAQAYDELVSFLVQREQVQRSQYTPLCSENQKPDARSAVAAPT